MPKTQMKLGLSLRYLGYHDAAWRHPEVPPGGATDFKYFLNSTRIAESAKFDMVFFADGIGIRADDNPPGSLARSNRNAELEPLTLLSALGAMTSHIGLVSTASTTYNEPFHVARKFASLDNISGGRAGWNIVTSWSDAGRLELQPRARISTTTPAMTGPRNSSMSSPACGTAGKRTPSFTTRRRASSTTRPSCTCSITAESISRSVGRSTRRPRRRAGRSWCRPAPAEQGQEIAAANADVVYAAQVDIAGAKAYYVSLKARMAKYGRAPHLLKIMPAVTTIVGRTRAGAQAKFDQLQELIDPLVGIASLFTSFGDLSGYPLDGPVPRAGQRQGAQHRLATCGTWRSARI